MNVDMRTLPHVFSQNANFFSIFDNFFPFFHIFYCNFMPPIDGINRLYCKCILVVFYHNVR